MAAAYAALVSVMHIIETIKNHPRPPISFDKEQLQSLVQNISFLQEFLENHSIDDDSLESRIAYAAYAAEDVIESHIVDQIEGISSADFYDGLHKVIQDLDMIQRDVTGFAKKTRIKDDDGDQLMHNNNSLRRSHSSTCQDTIVGFDDVIVEVMNKLTGYQTNRQIIPIVGMGGIGKTTLASKIYVNPVIVHYFDFRGWATISQEYNSKEILIEVLLCLNTMGSRISMSEMSEDELGEELYKKLFGRRYLIVLDDVWNIEAWYKVKKFFPDSNDGSAIMLTTRLSNLAFQLSESCFEMRFLDEDKSWNLFFKITFGEERCPRELENIGKTIVKNCKGLPLSIVVVGGLLAKSKRTREYWLYIAENLNSILNSEDDKRCLKILYLSYKELPIHLKPCFLYMGVYPEDSVINVPNLMRLWVAEGFLKRISGKCLEVIAKEYFNDLVDRNLILVHERGYNGETIKCKVHDLLVDVCFKEAQRHKFLYVAGHYNFSNPQDMSTQRRIVVHDDTKFEVVHALSSHGTFVRSVTCNYYDSFSESFNFRLLRVWNRGEVVRQCFSRHFLKTTRGILNCRYISDLPINSSNPTLPSSISSLWNLQTLYVGNPMAVLATSEIWKLSQLRHVHGHWGLHLLDPPPSGHTNDFVLGNLQTLSNVKNFKFSEDMVKRIPNIKELGVYYEGIEDWSSYCLNNLAQLIKLESFSFSIGFQEESIPSNLTFPRSLKELTLEGTHLGWGELGTKIGSLPHLQVLKLLMDSFVGPEWETMEGRFLSLKYLEISYLDLKYWRTESWTHFPCLEHLHLDRLTKLKEIPLEIGETLKSIKMVLCSVSAAFSAMEILKEQEDLGNEGLQVQVTIRKGEHPDVESLAAPKFQNDMFLGPSTNEKKIIDSSEEACTLEDCFVIDGAKPATVDINMAKPSPLMKQCHQV